MNSNGLTTNFYLINGVDDQYLFTMNHRYSVDEYDINHTMKDLSWMMSDLSLSDEGVLSFKLDNKLITILNHQESDIEYIAGLFSNDDEIVSSLEVDVISLNKFGERGYISFEEVDDLISSELDYFIKGDHDNEIINVASVYQDLNQSWFSWLQNDAFM